MKYSEIKNLKEFCNGLDSEPDWREVLENILDRNDDFEVSNVRFILDDSIDSIQQDELSSDLYCLGCFNADFLADYLPIDAEDIKNIQDAGAYEAIGKMILPVIEDVQKAYASVDGYGHHFNHYDFNEDEIFINGNLYHVFDNH